MTLSRLPPELRAQIASEIVNDPEFVRRSRYGSDCIRQCGRNLALVSRKWRDAGTAMAWDTVVLFVDCDHDWVPEIAHLELNSHLCHLVKVLTLKADYCDFVFDGARAAFSLFVERVWPKLHQLKQLVLILDHTSAAEFLPDSSSMANSMDFPQLEDFTYSLHSAAQRPTQSGSPAVPHLFRVLPTLKSLKSFDIKLRTRSEADCPSDLSGVHSLQRLERLRIDLAPWRYKPSFDDGSDTDGSETDLLGYMPGPVYPVTEIERECVLLYLLSLPAPTRLKELEVSATSVTASSLSVLKSFTSLTSLTLTLLPGNMEDLVDSLPDLVRSFPNLENLKLLTSHDYVRTRPFEIAPDQLDRFLSALPKSLVSLDTQCDLDDDTYGRVLDEWFDSRFDTASHSNLVAWSFSDTKWADEYLDFTWSRTRGPNFHLVRSERTKGQTGRDAWTRVGRTFFLSERSRLH